jgi:hypothetical protein
MVITRVAPASRQQIGDQLGADGHAGGHLFILAGIAVIRDDGCNSAGRRAFERIDHQKQFNQVVVDRVAGGLNDKNVFGPNVFVDFDLNFTVTEALTTWHRTGAFLRYSPILSARSGLEFPANIQKSLLFRVTVLNATPVRCSRLAGAGGFEPPNAGTKILCLAT